MSVHILPELRSRALDPLGPRTLCLSHTRPLSRRLCSLARGFFTAARSLGPCQPLAFPAQLQAAAAGLKAATENLFCGNGKCAVLSLVRQVWGGRPSGCHEQHQPVPYYGSHTGLPVQWSLRDWAGCESEQENRYNGVWFSA